MPRQEECGRLPLLKWGELGQLCLHLKHLCLDLAARLMIATQNNHYEVCVIVCRMCEI